MNSSSFRNSGRSTSHDDDDALQRALSISRKEALAKIVDEISKMTVDTPAQ